MLHRLAAAALACLFASPASANDSIAKLGAGGLILIQADSIAMEAEDLYVSPSAIRVDYRFRNNAAEDKTHLVAFPMPLIEPGDYLESDVSVPEREHDNFMNFAVGVDGVAVTPQIEIRALTGGLDVTGKLAALAIPLNPLAEATAKALNAVPKEKLSELLVMGAVRDAGDGFQPSWTLKSTYYWLQTFPAGKTIAVSHSYTPAVGLSFFYDMALAEKSYVDRFCIDAGTRKAIRKKLAAAKADSPLLMERQIQYILTTGANWQDPIGDFRLVVDKEKPEAIVSFCMDGVKKIGPTLFEVRKTDFEPRRDIDILIVEEIPRE